MRYTNLGKFSDIPSYINDKLTRLNLIEPDFSNIYEIMFENEPNTFFEESSGYRIKKITYGEAKKNVELMASNLKAAIGEVPYDSVVGIYLDNSHLWIETYWAILKCGFRPLLLNMRLSDSSLEDAMKNVNCIAVISEEKTFSVKSLFIDDLLKENDKAVNGRFGSEMFVMSSGTSSHVKICAYSAYEIKKILLQSSEVIRSSKLVQKHYNGELKLLAFLPFYHIFGFVALYLWFGLFSRTFVKLNDLSPQTIQNTIKKHHVTHIFAVPLFWQKTYDSVIKEIKSRGDKTYNKFLKGIKLAGKPIIGPLITKFALKEVRDNLFGDSVIYLITGGSVIDKKVLTMFNAIGYHISNGYGMSEIGITSVELSNNSKILNSASIGRPLPGLTYRINENGELFVKGETMAKYIIEDGKVIENKGKEFETHDLAKEVNGRYYLFGRHDDLVVSISGENLNPNIIEEELKVDNVSEVCLINGHNQNLPVLLVSVNRYLSLEKTNEIIEDIKVKINENNLSSQIGKVQLIAEPFISGDEFKMNRKKLENKFYNGELSEYSYKNDENNEDDEIVNKIKEMFAIALNKDAKEIHSESDFFLDEGGTSLDYFVIVNKIQEQFGINIGSTSTPLSSAKQIADYIRENL